MMGAIRQEVLSGLTTDKDFSRYRAVVPLKLHRPRVERSDDPSLRLQLFKIA